ncbi:unnamed protein product [Symbiodinium sp. CCMP2592]|nr:unnamed protein product [Symbiodinium sp. CCMP2592]
MSTDREELWPPICWTPRGASEGDGGASASDGIAAKTDVCDLWPPMEWSPAAKDTKAEADDEVPASLTQQKKDATNSEAPDLWPPIAWTPRSSDGDAKTPRDASELWPSLNWS